jgi:PadR family transcriptional regulator PadR
LLASEVEPSVSGPPRRYYRVTRPGREVLREWVAAWNATRDSVDKVLQGEV